MCKPGSRHTAEHEGSKPAGSKPGTRSEAGHSSVIFPLLQQWERISRAWCRYRSQGRSQCGTSSTQREPDFPLSKQGGHVENIAANGPWPDLHPKPCPKLVCREKLAQGPAFARTVANREHGQRSSVCWAFPSASAWCWGQTELSPGFGILSFLEQLGITLQ